MYPHHLMHHFVEVEIKQATEKEISPSVRKERVAPLLVGRLPVLTEATFQGDLVKYLPDM